MQRLSICFLVAGVAGMACADWRIGGGRYDGMAGVGVGLPRGVGYGARRNPALAGLSRKPFSFNFPQIGAEFKGISFSDIDELTGEIEDGGIDASKLGSFARKFGKQNIRVGFNANLGVSLAGVSIWADGEATGRTYPNASLANWSNSGAVGSAPSDARLDAYGYSRASMNVAYGVPVKVKGGNTLTVGATGKIVRSYYSHQFVDGTTISNSGSGQPGPEMGGSIVLQKESVGLDAGALLSLGKAKDTHIGVVVENLITPKVGFTSTDINGITSTLNPLKQMTHVGIGKVFADGKAMIGLDYVDIFNNNNEQELRIGGEMQLSKGFSIRGGKGSRRDWVVGASIGSINVAYSPSMRGALFSVIRF